MLRKSFLSLPLCLVVVALSIGSALALGAEGSPVKVWETQAVIPTYLAGAPEPNPMFFFGRESQGAQEPRSLHNPEAIWDNPSLSPWWSNRPPVGNARTTSIPGC